MKAGAAVVVLGPAILVATAAVAGPVYRCEVQGQAVYSDRPCEAGARPRTLPAIVTLPPGPASDLAGQHERRAEEARKAQALRDAEWLAAHEARKAEEARIQAAIAEHRVLKGMSADQLRRALGSPDEVERSGRSEQWIYGVGKTRRSVALEDGKVVRTPGAKK